MLFLFHSIKKTLSSERKRKLSFTQINSDSQLLSKNKQSCQERISEVGDLDAEYPKSEKNTFSCKR